MAAFAEATRVEAIDSHSYAASFRDEWCVGTVPHGGYVTACLLSAVRLHFSTTHASLSQPHTIILQSSFLRRASAGPAVFTLKDLKLGRRTSTIQATLTQGSEQVAIVSYVTQSNISAESGPSAPTHWALSPPPYPVDISKLKQDVDEHWTRVTERPFARFPKTIAHINFYLPRKGQLEMSIGDQFLQFADGGRFTMDSLGYAADLVQQVAESYFGEERARHPRAVSLGAHWYPTVVLNLEIKKVLPPDGVDFLFVRARAKQIKNGRADLEVVILDEDGELVALSHHVALILSSKRNTGKRGAKKDGGETKL